MILLIYIIKTLLISGLLFGYYYMFFRNRPFHRFNRFFLLSIPVLSFLLPALHFSMPSFWNQGYSGSTVRILGVGRGELEEAFTIYGPRNSSPHFSWQYTIILISILISGFLLLRLIKTIRFIYLLQKGKDHLELPGATIYFVSEKGTPFSFLKSIFWGKEQDFDSAAGQQILHHELFHVKNNHTHDILFLESVSIGFWFNPFFHFIRREIKAVHEYGADAYAIGNSDTYEYARLLLVKSSGSPVPFTHPFFKNQIKRRIAMITASKKSKNNLLGRFMVLPLIAILIGIFSFKIQNHFQVLPVKPIRVVIDAGHGGSFTGAESNGLFEKNINLAIAKKIKSLSGEYNVDVIMSRETDVTPGGNDLRESLEYIAALPKNKNADLFISIHTNATSDAQTDKLQTSKSGFEIYIPRTTSAVYANSVKLGSSITEFIKSDYLIESELKQTPGNGGNILILKKATVPALIIECGYMDNPTDLKYLQDEKSQEKIARDILEGIRKFAMQSTGYVKFTRSIADSVPADTVTEETLKNFDVGQIAKMDVDRNTNLITLTTKDGKKYVEVRTPAMLQSWDSARSSEMNHPDTANPHHEVFSQVEVDAEYPGGQRAWYEYLQKNMTYPEAAVTKEIQGQVVVKFIVRKSGAVTDIQVVSGPKELREASVTVIKGSGKWIPAKQNGLIVESWKTQPLNFKLETK